MRRPTNVSKQLGDWPPEPERRRVEIYDHFQLRWKVRELEIIDTQEIFGRVAPPGLKVFSWPGWRDSSWAPLVKAFFRDPMAALDRDLAIDLYPTDATRPYEPMRKSETILHACLKTDPENQEQLLNFVNRWGRLGDVKTVGAADKPVLMSRTCEPIISSLGRTPAILEIGGEVLFRDRLTSGWTSMDPRTPVRFRFSYETVASTTQHFKHIREMAERILRLQHETVPGNHPQWVQLLRDLTGRIVINSVIEPHSDGARRVWRAETLRDVLYLQLESWATGYTHLRRCAGCPIAFAPRRQNQFFHDRACKNRKMQQRHRAR
jgi:hypothetical protein